MRTLIKSILCAIFILASSAVSMASTWEWALYGTGAGSSDGFKNGLSAVYSTSEHKGGYIDVQGRLVIPYQYTYAFDFTPTVAVVYKDNKEAMIDRNGNIVFEFGKYKYYKFEESPDGYRIIDPVTNKSAYFNGTRFLTGFEYDYIDFVKYPFLSLNGESADGNRINNVLNVVTEELFTGSIALDYGDYVIVGNRVYSSDGEPLPHYLEKSSEGVYSFKDMSTQKYGLKDRSGRVILAARYPRIGSQLWKNDVIELLDSVAPGRYISVVFNRYGTEILRAGAGESLSVGADFIMSYTDWSDKSTFKYYDNNGNLLSNICGRQWFWKSSGLYSSSSTKELYNARTGIIQTNIEVPPHLPAEGMMRYKSEINGENRTFYKNIQAGNVIGPYEGGYDFKEGMAIVYLNGEKIAVDKAGVKYPLPSNIRLEGDFFSEGVIRAYDKDAGIYGFLYNPKGHNGYVYNQTAGDISDLAFSNKFEEAQELFDAGKYAQAKDIYYQLAMLRPSENASFDNYASCLFNLGLIDEAETAIEVALNNKPNDTFAIDLRDRIHERQRQIAQEEYEERPSTASVWSAIGDWANAIAGITGNMISISQSYQGGGYSQSYQGGGYDSGSASGGNYQQQYDNWARRAESNYNSLTNLGYSSTNRRGNKSGSTMQGMSGGNYVQQKRALREAQREMKKIRQKARQAGVNINKSQYEDASVSY